MPCPFNLGLSNIHYSVDTGSDKLINISHVLTMVLFNKDYNKKNNKGIQPKIIAKKITFKSEQNSEAKKRADGLYTRV
jgi:hypothetical protein